jgi:hypothetical protein
MWLIVLLIVSVLILFLIGCGACAHFYTPIKGRRYEPLLSLPFHSQSKIIKPNEIVIYMVATPEIAEYAQHTIETNRAYAKKWGMNFFVVEKNLVPELPINFTKLAAIKLLKQQFPNAKYFVHIDADAIIHNSDYDLRNIIANEMGTYDFLVSEDCYNTKVCSKPNKINSGVFIVKNSLMGNNLMNYWLNTTKPGQCGHKYVNQFPNCQLVFDHCVRPLFWMTIKVVPYNLLNGVDGLFIHHHMQGATRERVDSFKQTRMKTFDAYREGRARLKVF